MKVGILGTGFGSYHAKIFSKMNEIDLIKVFGRKEETLKHLSEQLGVFTTNNMEDIFKDPEIDLIDICLPTSLHTEAIQKAFKAGKHVLCETPLCYSPEELNIILEAKQTYGKYLFVDQSIKFDTEYRFLYNAMKEGTYGKLKALTIERKTPPIWGSLGVRDIITNLMIHDLDCVEWLFGLPISKSINTISSNANECHVRANLSYEDAMVDLIATSMMAKTYPFTVNYEALFEHASLEFHGTFTAEGDKKTLMEYTSHHKREIQLEDCDPYDAVIHHVVDCCLHGKDSILDAVNAGDSLSIAFGLNECIKFI